ncbi:MAG: cryptochrome/photolyase family protein [Bacteroidota bacterium]|jgi:deoxyribodipyrimidine photo-lyase
MQKIRICWFRRDLRLHDHHALHLALKGSVKVMPLFIFDSDILDRLPSPYDRRVDFICQALSAMKKILRSMGSDIRIEKGKPLEIFRKIAGEYAIEGVYCTRDYEPYATERDRQVETFLHTIGASLTCVKDQVIFEPHEVVKDDGKPYTVFTPFSKKWKKLFTLHHLENHDTSGMPQGLLNFVDDFDPVPPVIGFQHTDMVFENPVVNLDILKNYAESRNFPAVHGTTRLGIHNRFGTISIRHLVKLASVSESWLNELIWREFYMMILAWYPQVANQAFKPAYDRIQWLNRPEDFKRWCEGNTGYPMVDAGMRELNATGFMHNRTRMVVASFLTKHLLIDWRMGEAYFAEKLNDFDLSANNGGWQWAAGSGCDAAPYFRVFNPSEQLKKFDPSGAYVRKWIPEWNTSRYPKPVVDHVFARNRVLQTYKQALNP